jgi:succinate dehydrogenase/fumarate reductase flavoprotein subunit
MSEIRSEGYDLIVAGAGMAGLTAAGAVARRGGHVLVLEKAAEIGGSAIVSGGMVWTAERAADLIAQCPKADPQLIEVLCAELSRLLDNIRETGAIVEGEARVLGYGVGRRADLPPYLEACRAAVIEAGGQVVTRAQMFDLIVEDGKICGVEALVHGETMSIRSTWTLLSGGGFQADPELTAKYIHPNAPSMLLRSNRASTGDGLRPALAAGAALSESMTGFYGHLISWPTDIWNAGVFARISQYHSGKSALVNVLGEIFRPPFDNDHYNTQWAVKQPEGRAVLIMDQFRYDHQEAPTDVSIPVNRFEIGVEHGANTAVAPTLEALGDLISAWGFAGERLPQAIATFNATATEDRPALEQAPYYAIEIKPGITFTHGGLKIDEHARVQSVKGGPLPGLLAAGADAGGVFDGGYGGGLAAAGVFALRAADTVVTSLVASEQVRA